MDFKKILIILLIVGALLTIITPSTAFSIHKSDNNTVFYCNGESVINVAIYSKFGSDFEMKNDLDKINKIVVKINKKTVKNIQRNKGWNKYYPTGIIERRILVKGNIKNKNIIIQTYDKNNKLIKERVDKIQYLKKKQTILTKKEAIQIAKQLLKSNQKVGNAIYIPKFKSWDVDFVNIKTGKINGGTYVDDRRATIATGLINE